MKIIEQLLKSKTEFEIECEDSIFISNDFAAVIDGATSKSKKKYKNKTSGKVCAEILQSSLTSLKKNASVIQAINFLSKSIASFYDSSGTIQFVRDNPIERVSASIVIYSAARNEIWMVGDCQCMVDKTIYINKRLIDEYLSNARSLYIQSELKLGKSFRSIQENDSGRKYILPLLERQALFQNSTTKSEYNYGVIDGFKVANSDIKVIALDKPKSIVLASDGYPKLFSTLFKSEKYLSKLLKADPLCYKDYKSTKGLKKNYNSFDDRAYLRISLL